jgi:hypothetical protein
MRFLVQQIFDDGSTTPATEHSYGDAIEFKKYAGDDSITIWTINKGRKSSGCTIFEDTPVRISLVE